MSRSNVFEVLNQENKSEYTKEGLLNDENDDENENNNFILDSNNQAKNEDLQGTTSLNVNEKDYFISYNNYYKEPTIKPEDIKIGNISNYSSIIEKNNEQNTLNISLSKIDVDSSQYNEQSDFGSSCFLLENSDDESINKFILDKINEGFILFFAKLNGLKFYCILAKKDTLFLEVIKELKQRLNITNNLGNFYQNNNLIDCFKTVGELNINNLDRNITNYISDDED